MFSNQSLEKNCSRIPIEKFLIHWTYIASEFRRSGVKGIKVQTERCGFKHWWSMKCCCIGRHFSPAWLGPCCSKYERTYQGQARVLISCLQLFSEVLLLNIFSFPVLMSQTPKSNKKKHWHLKILLYSGLLFMDFETAQLCRSITEYRQTLEEQTKCGRTWRGRELYWLHFWPGSGGRSTLCCFKLQNLKENSGMVFSGIFFWPSAKLP